MVQALAALPEVWSSVFRLHMVAHIVCNSRPRRSNALFVLCGSCTHVVDIDTHACKTSNT